MRIEPFKVEEWMNSYEVGAKYNIAETCVDSISIDELFQLTGKDRAAFLDEICSRRLTYGDIEGAASFREGVCRLYRTLEPKNVVPTHGAAGANHHVFYSLLESGDEVVSITPTYQQLYSIPRSFGVEPKLLCLREEDGYLPDLEELRGLVTPKTKIICLNNPNNPTGSLMDTETLKAIVEIARSVDAYILCDEVYRHLTQDDSWSESIADLYEKGISVSSMSKVFSLAGLRLGWIATGDREAVAKFLSQRDYTLISCGLLDEALAGEALGDGDKLIERSRGIVRRNLKILDEWVQRQPHVRYVRPRAGTTALVYYDLDMDSYDFCREMYKETGAFVTPGGCFEMEHCMRIGYGSDTETLRDGLAAIDSYIAHKIATGTKLLSGQEGRL